MPSSKPDLPPVKLTAETLAVRGLLAGEAALPEHVAAIEMTARTQAGQLVTVVFPLSSFRASQHMAAVQKRAGAPDLVEGLG